jgi:kynurenine formamidase
MVACESEEAPPIRLPDDVRVADDTIFMYLQSGTQWDSLAHVYQGESLYNGFPASGTSMSGAANLGIDRVASSFIGRGVLLDVARHMGVDCLALDHAIDAQELDVVAGEQGIRVEKGDILLVRTGMMAEWARTGSWERCWSPQQPGLAASVAEWLHEAGVAAVASDNAAVERKADKSVPLHVVLLRDLGMCLGELWFLEELAADCAEDGVYEFLLVAQALPITGAVGSPVNPIAIK